VPPRKRRRKKNFVKFVNQRQNKKKNGSRETLSDKRKNIRKIRAQRKKTVDSMKSVYKFIHDISLVFSKPIHKEDDAKCTLTLNLSLRNFHSFIKHVT
jgi:uncharacterized protein YaaW (UPF0174 family)